MDPVLDPCCNNMELKGTAPDPNRVDPEPDTSWQLPTIGRFILGINGRPVEEEIRD
jgi:hypothetical protein